jgi:hypothetical protein
MYRMMMLGSYSNVILAPTVPVVSGYATFNTLDKSPIVALSGGNLVAGFGGAVSGVRSSIGKSTGK